MSRSRLLILFSLAACICIAAFTGVVYNSHVDEDNKRDQKYLKFYTEQVNEMRRKGIAREHIPLPDYIIQDNTYQIIVYHEHGEYEYWLKSHPWFTPIKNTLSFKYLHHQPQTYGHVKIKGEDIHWQKFKLQHPTASIFYIHQERDHWQGFNQIFVTPISILSIFILWTAIWSAMILSRLFEREHAKNELLQKQAVEICYARDEAYAATKAKSRFLANISHELRTPLTAILGFSENMLDSADINQAQTIPLHTIIRNGNYLLHVINELLDLSKIEENKLQIERIEFSAVQLLQDIELLMFQQAQNKGLEFKINYSWPLPEHIQGDPFRIKQILINLCSNSIKFTTRGYVHINFSCQRDEETICFEVIDTGIGIEQNSHEKIFQAFAQADVSTTRQYGGTGLGLALSKRLTELMGGTITLLSEPGKGAHFTVTLPIANLAKANFISDLSKQKLATLSEDRPEYELLKGRVLVADDAPDNRLLLSALLAKFGLDATIVENGQLALDTLANNAFDLILLDIQMPVLDGIQTLKVLREQGFDKPVIALTANTLDEDRKLYQAAGFTDFIAKPIRFKIINNILSKYLPQE